MKIEEDCHIYPTFIGFLLLICVATGSEEEMTASDGGQKFGSNAGQKTPCDTLRMAPWALVGVLFP